MPLSTYLKIYPDRECPGRYLLYSTKKGSLVRLSEAKLAAARSGTLAENDRAVLQRLEILVDDPIAERAAMADIVGRSNRQSRKFSATVVLTLDCNLACSYCFEDHFRGSFSMTDATADLLVAYVQREYMAKGHGAEIRFYGGEPLMALPLLRRIAGRLQEAAAESGTTFSCSMVSNGTLLTRTVVEELTALGLSSIQLTLDGPKAIHDPLRPFVSGAGSFDVILANIREVNDLVTLKLGGNFTRDNFREFPKMLDALLEAGVEPHRLGPVQFGPVLPKSGGVAGHEAAACCISGSEPWLVEATLFLREETLKRGFALDKPAMGACMVEFADSLVVACDGSLYKCPGFMGWPEMSVGTLAHGIGDYSASHNLTLWQNDDCLDCPYLPLCFGGCRLLTLMRNGAIDGPACRRDFFDAALERMILQK